MPEITSGKPDLEETWSKPFRVNSSESFDFVWKAHVQKELCQWAGDYQDPKKLGKGAQEAKMTGRAQQGVTVALKEWTELMNAWAPPECVDLAPITGGTTFMNNIWMFGLYPNMTYAGFGPNSASLLRFVVLGEITMLLIEPLSLLQIMGDAAKCPENLKGKSLTTLDELFQTIQNFTTEDLNALATQGATMLTTVQTKGSLLFVPQSWIVIEFTKPSSSSPLHYGIRKSFMLKSIAATQLYKRCLQFFADSGRDTSRMAEILKLMEA